ncbi:MAG: trimethylamine methyltransferase family protein, partial [Hyphomicrobiales bacterium]|nr:trimethylamine methyltransferase family protein [Hyphomicrobiales bacterium]
PGGSAAGMTDAKLPDQQAGYEKGISNVMAGLSGTNMIYESAGMHASLMGFCFESLLIDNDLIGQSLRCVRGIEVNDASLSLEVMRQVCLEGPGHYLGHAQTLELMQREYLYPDLANRSSPKEWVEEERPDIVEQASKAKQRILSEYFPDHIPDALDSSLREHFPIRLPREVMKP